MPWAIFDLGAQLNRFLLYVPVKCKSQRKAESLRNDLLKPYPYDNFWHERIVVREVPAKIDKTKRYAYHGVSLTIPEWSARVGISTCTLYGRLLRGMTIEEACLKPIRKEAKPRKETVHALQRIRDNEARKRRYYELKNSDPEAFEKFIKRIKDRVKRLHQKNREDENKRQASLTKTRARRRRYMQRLREDAERWAEFKAKRKTYDQRYYAKKVA